MQQVLPLLAQAVATAQQKGFDQTYQQLSNLHAQLTLIAQSNPSSLFQPLLTKIVTGIQNKLNDHSAAALNDAALTQDCQAQAQALFQIVMLSKSFTAQKSDNAKKNEQIRLFNEALRKLQETAEVSAADLLAFNNKMRELLANDENASHARRQSQPTMSAQQPFQAANLGNLFKGFSEMLDSSTSGDKESMKEASRTFVGSILGMIIEMIANVCISFAPSIAPLIGNLAKLAKGAFSQWFDVSMEESGLGQSKAQTQPAQPQVKTATAVPTTFANTSPVSNGMSGGTLHAMQNFIRNSLPIAQGFMGAVPASQPASSHTPRL